MVDQTPVLAEATATIPAICTLSPRDIPVAVALWHAASLTRPWNDPTADAHRALSPENPNSTILGAYDQHSSLIGTIMVGHDGHRGWIYYLAVSSSCQKQGVGVKLMTAAERWLAPHVPKVMLLIREDNQAARGFYDRIGYEESRVAVFQKVLEGGM